MKKASASKTMKPLKPISHLSDEEFLEWAEMNPLVFAGRDESEHWERYVDCWHRLRLPGEKKDRIQKFLKGWATPEAADHRADAYWSSRLSKVQSLVLEPLAMALATPKDPWHPVWRDISGTITQEMIDRRLANWLRDVILSKKTSRLEALATALQMIECPLYVGIHVTEITNSITSSRLPKSRGATRMYMEFFKLIRSQRRLPSMRKLADASEIYDAKNASYYRQILGLKGLPKSEPSW